MNCFRMNPRETEAIAYVEEHKLQPLMQQLIELTTYHQPGDPRAFMIGKVYLCSHFECFFLILDQLKHLISARESGTEPPTLLEANNFAAIFGLIDITGRGT